MQVREVGSGAAKRQAREKLLEAVRRREKWEHLGVGFVSLGEALV
ncbi:MAG: hypothetical protein ACJ74Y_03140 [Bryobacteraceae bacterium]